MPEGQGPLFPPQAPSGESSAGSDAGPGSANRRVWGLGVLAAVLAGVAVWLVCEERRAASAPAGLSAPFVYDLEALRKVDPKWIGYREVARLETGMQSVRALALGADSSVWVGGDRRLCRLSPEGGVAQEVTLSAEPYCLAVDGERVYVGLATRLVVYDLHGTVVQEWPDWGAPSLLTGIAVVDAQVYVADSGRRLVWRCSLEGTVRGKIGGRNPAVGHPGLIVPSPHLDVAADHDGRIYVTNPGRHQIESYTPDGDRIEGWGRAGMGIEGFSGCCNPVALVRLGDGRFITAEKGLARVKRLGPNGSLECLVAAPLDFTAEGFGTDLAVDARGRVYVLDTGTRTVRIFEAVTPGDKP